MKKIIYLAFLAIGMTGCSVESMDSTENLIIADAKHNVTVAQETLDPMGFYTGNNTLKGTISITNDCDNLYIEILPTGDDPDGVKLGLFQGETNPKENGTDSDLATLDMSGDLVWAFPLSEFDELAELRIFVKAWGDYSGNIEWGNKASYFIYEFEEVTCEEESECPSGYMIGDTELRDIDNSNNWGWAHEFNLERGATERINIQHKNDVLGQVDITLNWDSTVTILEGPGVEITHMYIADAKPTNTAPGIFNKTGNLGDENGNGKFWVIIKADVCE